MDANQFYLYVRWKLDVMDFHDLIACLLDVYGMDLLNFQPILIFYCIECVGGNYTALLHYQRNVAVWFIVATAMATAHRSFAKYINLKDM